MNVRSRCAILAILAIAGIGGCATLTKGTTQMMTVNSNVSGARVFLDANEVGTTPFVGAVPKNKAALRVEAPGYQGETIALAKTMEPVFWGNIILGGTLGSITDFASGAAYQYAPASYHVELRTANQSNDAFMEQLLVRKFAMLYVDEITRDVAAGSGDYLTAMTRLLNLSKYRGLGENDVMRALAESNGGITSFGANVVALL